MAKHERWEECETHSLWYTHLTVALWLMLILAWVSIFTDRWGFVLPLVGFSVGLWLYRERMEVKHIHWHATTKKGHRDDTNLL